MIRLTLSILACLLFGFGSATAGQTRQPDSRLVPLQTTSIASLDDAARQKKPAADKRLADVDRCTQRAREEALRCLAETDAIVSEYLNAEIQLYGTRAETKRQEATEIRTLIKRAESADALPDARSGRDDFGVDWMARKTKEFRDELSTLEQKSKDQLLDADQQRKASLRLMLRSFEQGVRDAQEIREQQIDFEGYRRAAVASLNDALTYTNGLAGVYEGRQSVYKGRLRILQMYLDSEKSRILRDRVLTEDPVDPRDGGKLKKKGS